MALRPGDTGTLLTSRLRSNVRTAYRTCSPSTATKAVSVSCKLRLPVVAGWTCHCHSVTAPTGCCVGVICSILKSMPVSVASMTSDARTCAPSCRPTFRSCCCSSTIDSWSDNLNCTTLVSPTRKEVGAVKAMFVSGSSSRMRLIGRSMRRRALAFAGGSEPAVGLGVAPAVGSTGGGVAPTVGTGVAPIVGSIVGDGVAPDLGLAEPPQPLTPSATPSAAMDMTAEALADEIHEKDSRMRVAITTAQYPSRAESQGRILNARLGRRTGARVSTSVCGPAISRLGDMRYPQCARARDVWGRRARARRRRRGTSRPPPAASRRGTGRGGRDLRLDGRGQARRALNAWTGAEKPLSFFLPASENS